MTEVTESDLELGAAHGALWVTLRGVTGEDPIKLLEDTARFLRDYNAKEIIDGRDPDEDLELMYKRRDLGDYVIFAIKAKGRTR
ncbi:hypothetical protein [Sphingomonas koreensis]